MAQSSGPLTRDEAIERQDLDNGDPEQTVFVVSNKRSVTRIYHENDRCKRLKGRDATLKEYSRKEAKLRWLGPCQSCILGGAP